MFIVMPTDIITEDGTVLVTSVHEYEKVSNRFYFILISFSVLDIDVQAAISSYAHFKDLIEVDDKTEVTESEDEIQSIKVVQPLSAEEKKKKFPCSYCDFRAMTPVGLKKHLNKVHPYPD